MKLSHKCTKANSKMFLEFWNFQLYKLEMQHNVKIHNRTVRAWLEHCSVCAEHNFILPLYFYYSFALSVTSPLKKSPSC